MPLQKTVIPLSFAGGIDTKTDPKQVVQGKLLSLVNAQFASPGRLKKRNGTAAFATAPAGSSIGGSVIPFENSLLSLDGQGNAFSLDETLSAWIVKGKNAVADVSSTPFGSAYSADLKKFPIYTTDTSITDCDMAVSPSGMQFFVFSLPGSGAYAVVADPITGMTRYLGSMVYATPKVIFYANNFVIFGTDGAGGLNYLLYSSSLVYTGAGAVQGTAGAAGTVKFDAAIVNGTLHVLHNGVVGVGNKAKDVSFDGSMTQTVYTTAISNLTLNALSVFTAADGVTPQYAWSDGGGAYTMVKGAGGPTNLDATTPIQNIAGVSGKGWVYWTVSAADPSNWYVKTNAVNGAPDTPVQRGVALCGKPMWDSTRNIVHVPVSHSSPLQKCMFLLAGPASVSNGAQPFDILGSITVRAAYGTSSGHLSLSMLPETTLSGPILYLPILETGSQSGSGTDPVGISLLRLAFSGVGRFNRAQLGEGLHLSGGVMRLYDRNRWSEHGFLLFPEGLSLTNPATGSYNYSYVATYEWSDAAGLRHRSAVSPAVAIQRSAAIDNSSPGTSTVDVTIPTMRLTDKPRSIQNKYCGMVCLYRTLNNGTTYYLVQSSTNDLSVDSLTIRDGITDTQLNSASHPLLYSTAALENDAVGAVAAMTVYRERVFAVDAEDRGSVWFSQRVGPGSPVEFSEALSIDLGAPGGECVALGVLDDKLIIFKRNAVAVVVGNGPDANGAQNDYLPQYVSVDVGCIDARSVTNIPVGLLFKSAKGFCLLDRSLQVSYIGAEVEAYNAPSVAAAITVPVLNQARFLLATGVVLVFDYLLNQWSTFSYPGLPQLVDMTVFQDSPAFVDVNGQVYQETPGVFTDNGSAYAMSATTSWLKFAGLQGYQRVYKLLLLGEYASSHALTVQVAYDFDGTIKQTKAILPSNSPPYQYRFDLAQQKCSAIQLLISETDVSAGQAMSLSALSFEVGMKTGLRKIPVAT